MAKQSHPAAPAKRSAKAAVFRWLPAAAAVLFAAIIVICMIAPRDLGAAKVVNVLVLLLIGAVFAICWHAEGKTDR